MTIISNEYEKNTIIIILCNTSYHFFFCEGHGDNKVNQSPIRIGNRSLKVGDTFSDAEVISWSLIKQDMKAKPKSGGLPLHYSAAAFKRKSQQEIGHGEGYIDFELLMRLTVDLNSHFVSRSYLVEVFEPQWWPMRSIKYTDTQ